MSYHLHAWIKNNSVCMIECDENHIKENHVPDLECDFIISAQVSGTYQEAGDVFPLVGFDGKSLIGLDFIEQTHLSGVKLSNEELAAQARAKRNELLAATDWTQAADVPQATKNKWAPYRQALRDVPQQSGFPQSIDWPIKPV